jgi:hypothetical protein
MEILQEIINEVYEHQIYEIFEVFKKEDEGLNDEEIYCIIACCAALDS